MEIKIDLEVHKGGFILGILSLQQQNVLSELYHYVHQTPTPEDSFSAMTTLSYLEACNKIFEQGLLSHEKVSSSDHQVIINIKDGYQFFKGWLDEIYEMGMCSIVNGEMMPCIITGCFHGVLKPRTVQLL